MGPNAPEASEEPSVRTPPPWMRFDRTCLLLSTAQTQLHDPPPGQHPETSLRHELLPIDLFAFFRPLLCPNLRHLLGYGLGRFVHDFHAQAQRLFGPSPAPALLARVQPQVLQTGEPGTRRLE